MTSSFTREQLKLSIAKMCLTIGWHTTMTTPIELLTDILCNYLCQLGKLTNDYANGFGLREASIEHLLLAFKEFHVNLQDLTEFVKNVDCPEPPLVVPLYPVPKEDHLNFLKPGSKEVVTRQVHIHEHLPPMFPQLEEENSSEEPAKTEIPELVDEVENIDSIFKRPAEVSHDVFKRPRILSDDESGRPTREISSVMMTSSGFLSPAREGRLPEARTPAIALEPSTPMIPNEHIDHVKKPTKGLKKSDKLKGSSPREMFKTFKDSHSHKHVSDLKNEIRNKTKHRAHIAASVSSLPVKNYMVVNEAKSDTIIQRKQSLEHDNQMKFNKTLAAARMKTERFNTTITPVPPRSMPETIVRPEQIVDKLFTEPDKKKVDIFKKISVKADRADKHHRFKAELKIESRESSPDLIIDESVNLGKSRRNLPKDVTIELVHPSSKRSPEKSDKLEKLCFDDYSPPGTPSTPRTPDMISHSPPLCRGEKKAKSKHRKVHKYSSPSGVDMNLVEVEMERPKTPDSSIIMRTEKRKHTTGPTLRFPFFTPFSGPGLIPTPLTNPLFPHLPIPPLGLPNFGQPHFVQPPYIPSIHSSMPMNFTPPIHSPLFPSSSVYSQVPPTVVDPTVPSASVPAPSVSPVSSSVITSTAVKEEELDVSQQFRSTSLDRSMSPQLQIADDDDISTISNVEKKLKEHKKDKKDKIKKKNKKDKHKSEKRKLKEEKKEKSRIKKEKKKRKSKEIHFLNIKPIVKQEETIEPEPSTSRTPENAPKREMSPELARFSALVTGQPKPRSHIAVSSTSTSIDTFPTSSDSLNTKKSITPKVRTREIPVAPTYVVEPSASCYIDSTGKKIWICPACGVQDDGSPMIGCDDCDAWYHWVCVGIQVPPDDNEDWYCRHCIGRSTDLLKRDRKRKRKSKDGRSHKH